MIGAYFQSLVSTHDKTSLLILAMLQQSNISRTTFLPFATLTIKTEKLGAHLKDLFFLFFVGLLLDLLGEMYNRFKMNVDFTFRILLFLSK